MTSLVFNEDIRDGIQEIANVAVGMAADNIAKSFSAFVKMPIPQVHLIESADIQMALGSVFAGESVTAVTQAFYANGLSGEALLLCADANMADLSALMGYGTDHDHKEVELVLEMASLLNGSSLIGFCSQLDINVLLKHPQVYGEHASLNDIFSNRVFPWKKTLAIELNYGFEGYDLSCDLVLLFHEDSLPHLFEHIQFLLE